MAQQHSFDFDRRNIFAAADDHVLEAVANLDIAVRMHDRGIAAVKPSAAHRVGRCLRVVVIALHHDVAADADLTQRASVMRNLLAGFVEHAQVAGCHQLHALPRFDDAPLLE